ncbi:MAG: cupredoxin domain-containing protein [Undibacterium sp.]
MKIIFGIILLAAVGFVGYLFMQTGGSNATSDTPSTGNVSLVDGQQIVTLTAKVGYTPRVSTVKAGIPTILRVETKGTFDCSSQIRVPSLNISQALPATGTTDIVLGTLTAGELDGTCGMGMYPFQLNVEG